MKAPSLNTSAPLLSMNSARQKIVKLLERAMGLNVDTVSGSTFSRAIQCRMGSLGLEDMEAYVRKLTVSAGELHNLIEEVVIPETWFFRHREPFNVLIDQAYKVNRSGHPGLFRILSLPCSTGEEPYSVVMALLQAGIDPSCFQVMAVDISDRALAIARRGVYRENSFRSKDLSFRGTFFKQVGQEFVLSKTVRSLVQFSQGNILDPLFTRTLGCFDIIFCRNILIYFGAEAQKKVIDDLHNLVVPGGTLFTGHAEANLFLNSRFVRSPHADSFAFYREKKEPVILVPKIQNNNDKRISRVPRTVRTVVCPPSPDTKEDTFESVMRLANSGRLVEAACCCEKHLQGGGASTRWYYLLGVICDSLGRQDEAVTLLRKAVYLDPEHEESLMLLSLLAEQAGDYSKAVNYKKRAQRLQQRG